MAAPATSQAKAPRGFFGAIDFLPPNNLSQPQRDDMYALMHDSGVESVRSFFAWSNVETAKGTYNWTGLDRTGRPVGQPRPHDPRHDPGHAALGLHPA